MSKLQGSAELIVPGAPIAKLGIVVGRSVGISAPPHITVSEHWLVSGPPLVTFIVTVHW
jgi:hypothetical protein